MMRIAGPLGSLCNDIDDHPESPLMRVWQECRKCGMTISEHVYDSRSATDKASAQSNGENDALLMQGHWAQAHPAELVAHNLRLGR